VQLNWWGQPPLGYNKNKAQKSQQKQASKEGTEFVTQHPPVHHPLEIRSL
jgi:hypothetical protein